MKHATLIMLMIIGVLVWRSRVPVLPVNLVGVDFPEIRAVNMGDPKLPRLEQKEQFPFLYREAASLVASAISKEGLRPSEYLVEVRVEFGGRVLRFELWHESIVGSNYDPHSAGDRSGKCRTVSFDSMAGVVTKISGWR